MKPSDLKDIYPMNSVDQKCEFEGHMHFLMDILARNGNEFRELSWNEYVTNGGKDTKEILAHFNRYIKTEDTIRLYSDAYNLKKNLSLTTKNSSHMEQQTQKFKTTNDLLNEVGEDIKLLISWAQADLDHATESKDEPSRHDAHFRIRKLDNLLNDLKQCYKN